MKIFKIFSVLALLIFCFVSCTEDEDENEGGSHGGGQSCESTFDCPVGYICDSEKKICTNESQNGGNGGNSGGGDTDSDDSDTDSGHSGKQDGDDDPITGMRISGTR